jgi:2-alkyl-3-oxoalkanoate reductase
MRIFVAGATGVVGRRLIPKLVAAGHDVVGSTQSAGKAEILRRVGAEPATVDLLDVHSVLNAVAEARPEIIIHQATALSGLSTSMRRFDADFAMTNRLRTEGTDNLLAAAYEVEARRFVAQGFTGWTNPREGGPIKTEEDPLDPEPPAACRRTLEAIRYLEATVSRAEGVEGLVLRYAGFYGPGTAFSQQGMIVELIRMRRFPIIGGGAGIWSFVHVEDVADATLAAVERGDPGVYNVVDDEPAPVSEWLPHLAHILNAPLPRRVPRWLGRLVAGGFAVAVMEEMRGSSNAKAKRELGWKPKHASWRNGFKDLTSDTEEMTRR